ncbi:MAG: MBOAT family O-acyltransferase [Bacteroidia bacterium]
MLLFYLIAFGLLGIAVGSLARSRTNIILLLSAGSIALISPASLLFCIILAGLNFLILKKVSGKQFLFFFGLVVNAGALLSFHFYENLYREFSWAGLPVVLGVSYLVLQLIDYLCKVYFGQTTAPRDFIKFSAAVLYLPKFFSGPVASLPDVEKELVKPNEKNGVAYGLNRILLGLFKKLVLAESISPIVHSVFDFNDVYPGLTVLVAAMLYAMQLYFDFSGYSDIAIGVSSLWKIELPENFNFPFRQKSWSSFWKSWHSSLTNWLWQYVFNPIYLNLSRHGTNRILVYIICTTQVFMWMAFFNGLRAGFYVSAGFFGFCYLFELLFKTRQSFLYGVLVFVFFSVGLIYFRCTEKAQFSLLTAQLLDAPNFLPKEWLKLFFAPLASGGTQQDYFNLNVTLVLAILFLLFERKIFSVFSAQKINYTAWFAFILLICTWGVFSSGERFIYMQF